MCAPLSLQLSHLGYLFYNYHVRRKLSKTGPCASITEFSESNGEDFIHVTPAQVNAGIPRLDRVRIV
jgi:hypothetical protein